MSAFFPSVCLPAYLPACRFASVSQSCLPVCLYTCVCWLSAVLYVYSRSVWQCYRLAVTTLPWLWQHYPGCGAGEARTEAMVAAKGKATGEDDNDFDSFVEPAGLILSTVIGMMPGEYHDKGRLLREAKNMKLPGNPLVRPSPCTCLSATCVAHCQRGLSLIASLVHSVLSGAAINHSIDRLCRTCTICCPQKIRYILLQFNRHSTDIQDMMQQQSKC